jgi:hypothetical protein
VDWNLIVGLLVLAVASATLYITARERRSNQSHREREGTAEFEFRGVRYYSGPPAPRHCAYFHNTGPGTAHAVSDWYTSAEGKAFAKVADSDVSIPAGELYRSPNNLPGFGDDTTVLVSIPLARRSRPPDPRPRPPLHRRHRRTLIH